MQRGQRYISGRCYMLFNAMPWFPAHLELSHEETEAALTRETTAARSRYTYVRVIRDKRRYRAFVYVL